MREGSSVCPESVGWASSIDVLPLDKVVERCGGYLAVRSPGNPSHYWGNFLLFDKPPRHGDASRWEALFEDVFGDEPRVRHRTFGWGLTKTDIGAARSEFVDRGYNLDENVALIASAAQLQPHPRQSSQVEVRALDPAEGADVEFWDAVVELQVHGRDAGHEEDAYRAFSRQRLDDLCSLFRAGRGAWYVALDRATGTVVGSCGIVATAGRGRYQAVDTAPAFRRRGICSRLVVELAGEVDWAFVNVNLRAYYAEGSKTLAFEVAEQLGIVQCVDRVVADPRHPAEPTPETTSAGRLNCPRWA